MYPDTDTIPMATAAAAYEFIEASPAAVVLAPAEYWREVQAALRRATTPEARLRIATDAIEHLSPIRNELAALGMAENVEMLRHAAPGPAAAVIRPILMNLPACRDWIERMEAGWAAIDVKRASETAARREADEREAPYRLFTKLRAAGFELGVSDDDGITLPPGQVAKLSRGDAEELKLQKAAIVLILRSELQHEAPVAVA